MRAETAGEKTGDFVQGQGKTIAVRTRQRRAAKFDQVIVRVNAVPNAPDINQHTAHERTVETHGTVDGLEHGAALLQLAYGKP